MLGLRALLLAITALLAVPAFAGAVCPDRGAYPGDDAAAAADIAGWMAYGAAARGVPRELPVMAALVESGLKNVSFGDADQVGYFQMRVSIWDHGAYAGFPTNPPLRLAEARELIGPPCTDVVPPGEGPSAPSEARPVTGPSGTPPPAPDVDPPTVSLARALGALPLRARVSVPVRCPAETCVVWATGSISVSTAARTYRIAAPRRTLSRGARGVVRLALGRNLRKAAAAALDDGRKIRGRVVIHAVDQSGNEATARRSIRLRRP